MRTLEQRQTIRAADDIKRAERKERKAALPSRAKAPAKIQHKRTEPTAPGQRDPRQTIKAHKGAVSQLFCIATLIRTGREVYGVQVAHLRFSTAEHGPNPGMQRKPHDFLVTPLAPGEHLAQHRMKEATYWGELGIEDPHALAKALFAASPDIDAMKDALRLAAARAWVSFGGSAK